MSAATRHPAHGAAVVLGGLVLMSAPVIAVPLLMAGGWPTTIAGAVVLWGAVRMLARDGGVR